MTAELRPRGAWEAADFGARLIRRDAAIVYRVWFAITLPLIALTVLAIAYGPSPMLALAAYWWLEPIADGPMLHVISRRLFGDTPTVRAAVRAAPALAWRNRIFLISPYRFHIARAIAMPLTQLEGMKGRDRRARASVVGARIMRQGMGLTVAYQHLALSLYFGVILLGVAFVPAEFRATLGSDWFGLFSGETRTSVIFVLLAGYAAQSALQPWFVGAGFGLYINCRTELEAWDLEIAFRRIVQRRAGRAAVAAVLAAGVLGPMIALPNMAWGQIAETSPIGVTAAPGIEGYWSDDEIRPALDEVMSSRELAPIREVATWQRKDRSEPAEPPPDARLAALRRLLASLGKALASVTEIALWIALGALLIAAGVAVARWRAGAVASAAGNGVSHVHRVVLADGEITADTLPADVPAAALALWRAGELRRAMSLLYRGSVFAAVHRYGVRLPPSATEGMCIAAVTEQAPAAQAEFFCKLVGAWTWCAYAGRDPGDELVALICAEWPQHFGGPQ